jgi:hypothetical protein
MGAGQMKYQINSSAGFHIFYAGLTSTTERELFRIDGSGNCTPAASFIGGINIRNYTMSATFPWPDSTPTSPGNWVLYDSAGSVTLNNISNGTFRNDNAFSVWATITWAASRDFNIFGGNTYWINEDSTGRRWGQSDVTSIDSTSITAIFKLAPTQSFTLTGIQDSGSGNDFSSTGTLSYILNRV